MKKKCNLIISILIALILCTHSSMLGQNAIHQLQQNYQQHTSQERLDIYEGFIAEHFQFGLDSALTLYQEMSDWGISIGDSVVTGVAYNNMGQIYKMKSTDSLCLIMNYRSLPYLQNNKPLLQQTYGSIATEYCNNYQLDSAKVYLDKAYKLHEEINDTMYFQALCIIKGSYYSNQELFHSALQQYQLALKYKEHFNSPLKEVNVHLNIADIYSYLKNYNQAHLYLDQAEKISNENDYKMNLLRVMMKRASYQMKEKKWSDALENLKAVELKIDRKKNINHIASIYSNLTITYTELKDYQSAEAYYKRLQKIANDQLSTRNKKSKYNAEWRYLQSIGEYVRSKKTLDLYLEEASKTKLTNNKVNALGGLENYYENIGDWKNMALVAKDKNRLILELQQKTSANLLYDLENKYQTNQKELEIQNLNSINKSQAATLDQKAKENRLYLLLLSLAAMAIAAGIYAYRTIKNVNDQLSKANTKLEKTIDTNKMLVKEVHHRVKNNLQVISSLLGLQQVYMKDATAKQAILTSKTRVQSMSLLHQRLYQNEDISKVEIKEYFENLILNLYQSYKVNQDQIVLTSNIQSITMNVDTVIIMGIIINELVSNALKHAFQNQSNGNIDIDISHNNGNIYISLHDTGRGMDIEKASQNSTSLGMKLIHSFTEKLDGEITITSEKGTGFEIVFPYDLNPI